MPRARTSIQDNRQTGATQDGSGCLSLYSLPLFAIILITCLITALAFNTPIVTSAASSSQIVSNTSTSRLSPIFTREVQYWADDILRWAGASSLDPNLVAVVMQIESCGDPFARSSAGAVGLFQVMPFHFQTGENPFETNTNALRGMNYLARSMDTARGNVRLALAGYNAGENAVINHKGIPPYAETRTYVQRVLRFYQEYSKETKTSIPSTHSTN